jgi:hypothetical protein
MILKENLKNITHIATRLIPFHRGKYYYDELLHVGKIGLYEAYKSYNSTKNNGTAVKFWSHAQYRVRGSMIDFISLQLNMIRPSRSVENIGLKILKLNLEDNTPGSIAESLNCTERIANLALEFIQIKYVDSLNRSLNETYDDHTLELGDSIPILTDFTCVEVEHFMTSLNSYETAYLQCRLLNYSDNEIEIEMGINNVQLIHIQRTLQKRYRVLDGKEQSIEEEDDLMEVYENKRPDLTKVEFLKLKNSRMLDKDICRDFGISKSVLIKNKRKWGLDQPRNKPLKERVTAIGAAPSTINLNGNIYKESDMMNLRNMISTLEEKINEFEREREVTRTQIEMEREAFWTMQDILRAEIKKLKNLITIKH